MSPRTLLSGLVPLLALGFARSAHADSIREHQPLLEASLGVRVSQVKDQGFDPFAESDELVQVSVGVGGTLLHLQRLSLAAVGFWDYGQRGSTARGSDASLSVHRLSIGPELRYHFIPRLYAFAHVLPAFAHSEATLEDSVALATRSASHWSFGADGALGAAFEAYAFRDVEPVHPRLWIIAEGGYGYLGSTRLRLAPESGQGAPERAEPVDLGSLSLSGPYLRISAAIGF